MERMLVVALAVVLLWEISHFGTQNRQCDNEWWKLFVIACIPGFIFRVRFPYCWACIMLFVKTRVSHAVRPLFKDIGTVFAFFTCFTLLFLRFHIGKFFQVLYNIILKFWFCLTFDSFLLDTDTYPLCDIKRNSCLFRLNDVEILSQLLICKEHSSFINANNRFF